MEEGGGGSTIDTAAAEAAERPQTPRESSNALLSRRGTLIQDILPDVSEHSKHPANRKVCSVISRRDGNLGSRLNAHAFEEGLHFPAFLSLGGASAGRSLTAGARVRCSLNRILGRG
jgi:hypothetical protein